MNVIYTFSAWDYVHLHLCYDKIVKSVKMYYMGFLRLFIYGPLCCTFLTCSCHGVAHRDTTGVSLRVLFYLDYL